MSAHTKEPWAHIKEGWFITTVIHGEVFHLLGRPLGANFQPPSKEMYANMDRTAACVNALAGLNPSAVPELVNMVGVVLNEPLSEGNRRLTLTEGLRTALAAAKKKEAQ